MIRPVAKIFGWVIAFAACVMLISSIIFSPAYMYRIIRYNESDIGDIHVFDAKVIERSDEPYIYDRHIDHSVGEMMLASGVTLNTLLKNSETNAFLIIHDDRIIYEYHGEGFDETSMHTSFSSAKSMVSLMVGIAIDEGFIESEHDRISKYIEEFEDSEFEDITIYDLLRMRSTIKYEEGMLWFGDDAKTYYFPDLRTLALDKTAIDHRYEGVFHYNNYHPLLLGIIIERATSMSVAEYFESRVWKNVGAQYDASWSVDSRKSNFEKMESGLNFRAVDYVKIGSMLLHNGRWNSQDVVSSDWLDRSIYPEIPYDQKEYTGSFLEDKNAAYQYMWYSNTGKSQHEKEDFYAVGKFGQFLYISPDTNTVILRTGKSMGEVAWWPVIFTEVIDIVIQP